jgi:hypothetical protein
MLNKQERVIPATLIRPKAPAHKKLCYEARVVRLAATPLKKEFSRSNLRRYGTLPQHIMTL